MRGEIRRIDYYYVTVPDKPGEGSRILTALHQAGINLLGVSAEVMERGKAKGRISVRRMQMKLLEQGNATIGVWLGKNILGQVDEVRHDINSGLPLLNLVPLIPPPTHPWSTATALPPPSDTSPKPTFDRNRVGESSYG